ncbi:MAG TPA: hypothetical protein PLP42_00145 [Acidobacteriota bacterium]|nr:hypothetical protein [Acidobacteriota bacterium]
MHESSSKRRAGTLILLLLVLTSCAKVAEPLPPMVRIPQATQELRLVQAGTTARLLFPLPSPEIETVLIYRQCGIVRSWSEDLDPLARVEVENLKTESPGIFTFVDTAPQPGCKYAIRYVNDQRRVSPFSNIRATLSQPVPQPPHDVRVQATPDRLVVTWVPPERALTGEPAKVVGYLVNGQHVVSAPRFEDRDFNWGTAKSYRVQAIAQLEDPLVLSDFSPEVTITPTDTFGPPPPTGLVGTFAEGKVQLLWQPSDADDVKGYRVYRGMTPTETTRINDLVRENGFTDTAPPPGDTLYYQVSAVDLRDNEGEKSEPLVIKPGG